MNDTNTQDKPVREGSVPRSNAWVGTLIKGLLFAIVLVVVFIVGCKMTMDSFQANYGDALVPRYNVEVTIDDIKAILESDTSDAEKLDSILSEIEVLEEEIHE